MAGEILLLQQETGVSRAQQDISHARSYPRDVLCGLWQQQAGPRHSSALWHSPVPTCTVMAAFFVMVWYIPMKATLLSRS